MLWEVSYFEVFPTVWGKKADNLITGITWMCNDLVGTVFIETQKSSVILYKKKHEVSKSIAI